MESEKDCIFCKIVQGRLPCHKVYEDSKFIAFLDIRPTCKGQTLVAPKEHKPSYVFKMRSVDYLDLMSVTKTVALLMDKAFGVRCTAMVMEGMGIDHAHNKLYPLHGIQGKTKRQWSEGEVYFDRYPGYVTTVRGPVAKKEELARVASLFQVRRNAP